MTQSQHEKKPRKPTTPAQSPTAKPSSPLGVNPLMAQQAMADPAQATPKNLLKLQRAYGNQSVSQMLTHQVEAMSNKHGALPGVIQRAFIPNADAFKENTNLGTFHRREDTLKVLDKLIVEYHQNIEGSATAEKVNNTLHLLAEMKQLADIWLNEHQQIENQDVLKYMKAFKEGVSREEIYYNRRKTDLEKKNVEIAEVTRNPNSKVQEIKLKHEGSVKSVFTKVAPEIDAAIPQRGDKCEMEVEVKFPLHPPGFIGGRMKFEAERLASGKAKLRAELAVTGGAKIPVVEVAGEVGGYLEAQAANTEDALQLISYALYRRFREAKWLPREAASYLWGGDSDEKGYRRAEAWSGQIEKNIFGKQSDAYAESGGLVGVKAKGDAGVAKLEGGITGTMGRKYTADSIKKFKGEFLKKEGQLDESKDVLGQTYMPTHRGGMKTFGLNIDALKFKFKAEAGPIKADATATLKWQENLPKEGEKKQYHKFSSAKLEAVAQIPPLPGVTLSAEVLRLFKNLAAGMESETKKQTKGQVAGESMEHLANFADAAAMLEGVKKYKAQWGDPVKGKPGELSKSLGATNSGALRIVAEWKDKKWKINLSFNTIKELKLDAGVFKGGIKKMTQDIALEYETGKGWDLAV